MIHSIWSPKVKGRNKKLFYFIRRLRQTFTFGERLLICLHNLIFFHFEHFITYRDDIRDVNHIYISTETRSFSRWKVSVHSQYNPTFACACIHAHDTVRPLVIIRATNPEPLELRINERPRYATQAVLVHRQAFCRGTIWRPWKSITISVREYDRQYTRT